MGPDLVECGAGKDRAFLFLPGAVYWRHKQKEVRFMEVGRSIPRVDAADKVTGRAKYTDDLCPRPVLEAKILHSTIANGWVKSMDISAAQALPGW